MTGSPPPMRGKESAAAALSGILGITPAYAGKSIASGASLIGMAGSPPPMRGKGMAKGSAALSQGITPAYAGKRDIFDRMAQTEQDHPRLCGEKKVCDGYTFGMRGSPPPMRGKGLCIVRIYDRFGITPAYAGKSFLFWYRPFGR